jgi:hypothetical protein
MQNYNKYPDPVVGQKFGKLEVLGFSHKKDGESYWNCRCVCGDESYHRKSFLVRGIRNQCRHCGKDASRNRLELGSIYGSWKILSEERGSHGETTYLCECECGTQKNIHPSVLKSNRRNKCNDCATKESGIVKRLILNPGDKFGKWTVLEQTEGKTHRTSYKCRCECGNERVIDGTILKNGESTQCKTCSQLETRLLVMGRKDDYYSRIQPHDKFGSWEVLGLPIRRKGIIKVHCRCDCGNETYIYCSNLLSGQTTRCHDCAMKSRITHGHTVGGKPTLTYKKWSTWKNRVTNPRSKPYKKINGVWVPILYEESFMEYEPFLAELGECPDPKLTIDRINWRGDYVIGNCRWATYTEQARNTSKNVNLELDGEVKCVAEWAEILSEKYGAVVTAGSIGSRIRRGWDDEKALTTPFRKSYNYFRNENPQASAQGL